MCNLENMETIDLTKEIDDIVNQGFKQYDIENSGAPGIHKPICFVIRQKNKLIGAVIGRIFWGAFHIKNVYTDKEYRNKGYAKKLMLRAIDYAREKECPFVFLETLDTQAPELYKKLGFKLEYRREGYSKGNAFNYMKLDIKNYS